MSSLKNEIGRRVDLCTYYITYVNIRRFSMILFETFENAFDFSATKEIIAVFINHSKDSSIIPWIIIVTIGILRMTTSCPRKKSDRNRGLRILGRLQTLHCGFYLSKCDLQNFGQPLNLVPRFCFGFFSLGARGLLLTDFTDFCFT